MAAKKKAPKKAVKKAAKKPAKKAAPKKAAPKKAAPKKAAARPAPKPAKPAPKAALKPSVKPGANAPSVLLVTIDALRADHVGALGHRAARTPNIDALAAQGVLFSQAFSHSMFTGPSHASILSGRSPLSTKFLVNHQGLSADVETLADALARVGYVTAAFPSSGSAAVHPC